MITCQACGSELDEELDKCPYCGSALKPAADGKQASSDEMNKASETAAAPAVTTVGIDISGKLQEMKSKIDQLAKEAQEKEQKLETPEETIVEPDKISIQTETNENAPEVEEPPPPEDEVTEEQSIDDEAFIDEAESDEYPEESEYFEEVGVEEQYSLSEQSLEDLGLTYDEARAVKLPERYAQKIRPVSMEKKRGIGYKIGAIAMSVILILVVWHVLFGLPFLTGTEEIIPTVDGQFDDWAKVVGYSALWLSDNSDIDFQYSAVQLYGDNLFWYFAIVEDLYHAASQVTSYSLLIDADGAHSTGYSLTWDFGADLMITISGIGGQKLANELLSFTSSDRHNWSAWAVINPSLDVAVVNNKAETCFSLPESGTSYSISAMRLGSVAYDGISRTSATPFFKLEPGTLVITQVSAVSAEGTLEPGPDEEIMMLNLQYFGPAHNINAINPHITGASISGGISVTGETLEQHPSGLTVSVFVDTGSSNSGTLVQAELSPSMVDSDFPSVMVFGKGAKAYVEEIPSWTSIDGVFAEWSNISDDNDTCAVGDPDVDIVGVSLETNSTDICIYGEVGGTIMDGELIPEGRMVMGSSGPVVIPDLPPRVTGWDVLSIFIDTDPSGASGAESPVNYSDITPDYKIELFGRNGEIVEYKMFIWDDDEWEEEFDPDIHLILGISSFELRISADEVENPGSVSVLMQMEDWLKVKDFSPELQSTPSV